MLKIHLNVWEADLPCVVQYFCQVQLLSAAKNLRLGQKQVKSK